MMELFLLFVFVVIVFTALFLAWYLIRSAKIKERLLLIEKGIDPKDINLFTDQKIHFPWLRIGIVISGIALGTLLVAIFTLSPAAQRFGHHLDGFSTGIILLFGGLSMILANFVGNSNK
jgi:hypothetical protein